MEFLYEYGLFLAKAITLVVTIFAIVAVVTSSAMKPMGKKGELELNDLSEEFSDVEEDITHYLLSKKQLKIKLKRIKRLPN